MPEIHSNLYLFRDTKYNSSTVADELERLRGYGRFDREDVRSKLSEAGLIRPNSELTAAEVEHRRSIMRNRSLTRTQVAWDIAFLRVLNPTLTLGEVRDAVQVWTDATHCFTSQTKIPQSAESLFYYLLASSTEGAYALRSAKMISDETYDLYCMQADHAKKKIAWECLPPATATRQSYALITDLRSFPFKTMPFRGEENGEH